MSRHGIAEFTATCILECMELAAASQAAFVTTRWSVVLQARDDSAGSSREALEALCQAYWRPIYAFVRRRGYSPADAQDLTQSFFAHFLERKLVSVVNRERGRFRTFLLHCCEYFLAKHWRDAQRLKRGGGKQFVPLDLIEAESLYTAGLVGPLTPEQLYQRNWALAALEHALVALRDEWVGAGKKETFNVLETFLSGERGAITCAQAALQLGVSEGAVRTAAHRLRQRYAELLRAEICGTLSDSRDIDQELRHLLSVL